MNQVTRLPTQDNSQLALMRRTVAADTNNDEFDLFIHTARHLGLDPLRRQIYAFVFGKKAKDQSKRKMSIITGIDGFRAIAERTGNYRPDEDEPTYEIDPALVGQSNPAGLVKATVRVFKFSHGAWHKATASAYWTEYAPLKEGWSDTRRIQDGEWPDGKPRYKDVPVEGATKIIALDDSGQWEKMPRLMLAKVAEALALRKAWPDNFANVYAAEEMDRAKVEDLLPSEAAEQGAVEDRMARIGAHRALTIDWLDGKALDAVSTGQLADRVMGFLRDHKGEPSQVLMFQERNRHALREFWAAAPGDALELKKAMESAVRSVPSETQEATAERVVNPIMAG